MTVVFNGGKHLEQAILSVITQSYGNFEYVIIDGGSTDETLDIIDKYTEQIDYWLSEPDSGIYEALNKAVKLARGDWLYVLGADDRLCPGSLERIAAYLLDKSVIYYGNVTMISDGSRYDGYFNAYKLMYKNICHQSILYPRRVFDYHRYEIRYKTSSDFVLAQKCHGDKRFRFEYVPVDVACYNNVLGVSSTREDPQYQADKKELIRANFSTFLYLLFLLRSYAASGLAILGVKDALKMFFRRCKSCWGR